MTISLLPILLALPVSEDGYRLLLYNPRRGHTPAIQDLVTVPSSPLFRKSHKHTPFEGGTSSSKFPLSGPTPSWGRADRVYCSVSDTPWRDFLLGLPTVRYREVLGQEVRSP